jgi:hypothetical protein
MLGGRVASWSAHGVHEGVQRLEGVMGGWQLLLAWAGPVCCAQHRACTQPALPVHVQHLLQAQNTTQHEGWVKLSVWMSLYQRQCNGFCSSLLLDRPVVNPQPVTNISGGQQP